MKDKELREILNKLGIIRFYNDRKAITDANTIRNIEHEIKLLNEKIEILIDFLNYKIEEQEGYIRRPRFKIIKKIKEKEVE